MNRNVFLSSKELPEEAVEAETIYDFQKHLDRYVDRRGLEGYAANVDKWVKRRMATWLA